MVVEAAPLIKQRRFRTVEVFCPRIGRHCAPTKANAPPPCIADWKDDAVAKAVIGRTTTIGQRHQTGLNHLINRDSLPTQRLQKTPTRIGGKSHFKPRQSRIWQPAPRQISACLPRRRAPQHHAIMAYRRLHHFGQSGQMIATHVVFWRHSRHLHASLSGQSLNRFHEPHILSFTQKAERITFGLAAKAIIIAFALINMKRRSFFLVKRARRPHVTLALVRLARIPNHTPPDNPRKRGAGAQLIKKSWRQTHGCNIGSSTCQVQHPRGLRAV